SLIHKPANACSIWTNWIRLFTELCCCWKMKEIFRSQSLFSWDKAMTLNAHSELSGLISMYPNTPQALSRIIHVLSRLLSDKNKIGLSANGLQSFGMKCTKIIKDRESCV